MTSYVNSYVEKTHLLRPPLGDVRNQPIKRLMAALIYNCSRIRRYTQLHVGNITVSTSVNCTIKNCCATRRDWRRGTILEEMVWWGTTKLQLATAALVNCHLRSPKFIAESGVFITLRIYFWLIRSGPVFPSHDLTLDLVEIFAVCERPLPLQGTVSERRNCRYILLPL